MRPNFMKGNYGLFIHYLIKKNNSAVTSEAWNKQTEQFDAEGLARQVHEAGAKWLFFTMGQASGHYAAPNAAFDEITGVTPSNCSKRDLPLALSEALAKYGIKLCLYMPSEAPNCPNFNWHYGKNKQTGEIYNDRQADFQRKWERVIAEWSTRYGERVSAWWIDSCYFADAMYNAPDEPNFHSFAAALRAGNPNALLAFNNGNALESITEENDYTPGEVITTLPIDFSTRIPLRVQTTTGEYPIAESPVQFHLLCAMGRDWGHLGSNYDPRFPDSLVSAYTEYILRMGGAMTWEVPINPENGLLDETFVQQLRVTKEHLERVGLQ